MIIAVANWFSSGVNRLKFSSLAGLQEGFMSHFFSAKKTKTQETC